VVDLSGHARFFARLPARGSTAGLSGFDVALRKGPGPATPRPDQEELHVVIRPPAAHGRGPDWSVGGRSRICRAPHRGRTLSRALVFEDATALDHHGDAGERADV